MCRFRYPANYARIRLADFASWQTTMGTTRGIIAEGTEGLINLGPERPRVYSELSQDEKDRTYGTMLKVLLEGSELTKEDRESQLYDDFEHFRQNKGETNSRLLWRLPSSSMTLAETSR
ncbi:hypothetical protein Tco_0320437 [Tanacetum coccineum]